MVRRAGLPSSHRDGGARMRAQRLHEVPAWQRCSGTKRRQESIALLVVPARPPIRSRMQAIATSVRARALAPRSRQPESALRTRPSKSVAPSRAPASAPRRRLAASASAIAAQRPSSSHAAFVLKHCVTLPCSRSWSHVFQKSACSVWPGGAPAGSDDSRIPLPFSVLNWKSRNRGQLNRVRRWAPTVHVVRHVPLVIDRVEVPAVPAVREHDRRAYMIPRAVMRREVARAIVLGAAPAHDLLRLRRPRVGTAGDHLEAVRVRVDVSVEAPAAVIHACAHRLERFAVTKRRRHPVGSGVAVEVTRRRRGTHVLCRRERVGGVVPVKGVVVRLTDCRARPLGLQATPRTQVCTLTVTRAAAIGCRRESGARDRR
jgi:hypothetical protein